MSANTPTARWKPQALVGELARAGWGDLAGADARGVTAVLTALADVVNLRTGEGSATLAEVGDRAQYSPKWVSRSLRRLEEVGVLEYTPGGVEAGKGVPSRFRLIKARLVELLVIARKARGAVLEARYAEVRDRIARARLMWTRRRPAGQNRRSSAWNSVPASPPQGGMPEAIPPAEPIPDPEENGRCRHGRRSYCPYCPGGHLAHLEEPT